jgi:hypothetical protein
VHGTENYCGHPNGQSRRQETNCQSEPWMKLG